MIDQSEEFNYFYNCEDYSILGNYWNPFFSYIQTFIPQEIHPNYITITSIISITSTYFLSSYLNNDIIFSLGIIYYMLSDGVDGVHARKTNKSSKTGEFLDHVGDVIINGLISDRILDNLSLGNDPMIKNSLMLFSSLYFTLPHFKAITEQKFIFNYFEDVPTMLILCSLINLIKPNILSFSDFLYKMLNSLTYFTLQTIISQKFINHFIFSILPLIFYMNILKSIITEKLVNQEFTLNKNSFVNSHLYVFYYFLKLCCSLFFTNKNFVFSYCFVDTFLMFFLIKSKMNNSKINYKILLIIIIFFITSQLLFSCFITIYTYYLIYIHYLRQKEIDNKIN